MNPTPILAGLLVFAFAALGSAKLAAVPVVHVRSGDGLPEIAPSLVLGLVALTFLVLVVGDLR